MSSTEDTIGSSSRGSDRDILSSIMTDEEAIAIEEAIVPPASNGSSATAAVFTCKGDRKLSAVSKQYDIDGDGELDEAEQASKYYIVSYMSWLMCIGDHCLVVSHQESPLIVYYRSGCFNYKVSCPLYSATYAPTYIDYLTLVFLLSIFIY